MANTPLKYESILVPLANADRLHMTRVYREKKEAGEPVFMLHSIAHDSATFLADDETGLACYLARQGYDVFVADLRGKGQSWPRVNSDSRFGLHQAITEDMPALLETVASKSGAAPQLWVGHGWGSVLMCSYYARYGDRHGVVRKMAHFGPRRAVREPNRRKNLCFKLWWRRVSAFFVWMNGYLPARTLRLGWSNESRASYQDYLRWSLPEEEWRDSEDGFHYSDAVLKQPLPPSFYFASVGDKTYGDLSDVKAFLHELGPHDGRLMVLSKAGGNQQNYSHMGMLQHKDADQDHFPILLDWLQTA